MAPEDRGRRGPRAEDSDRGPRAEQPARGAPGAACRRDVLAVRLSNLPNEEASESETTGNARTEGAGSPPGPARPSTSR